MPPAFPRSSPPLVVLLLFAGVPRPVASVECDSIISPITPHAFSLEWGTEGSGPGQFLGPWGVGVDPADNVWIVDRLNHNLQKFAPDGTWLETRGSHGWGEEQFLWPRGIDFDVSTGDYYVSQTGSNSIKKFDSSGSFLLEWGATGTEDGQFDWPDGVAVAPEGDVFVADHTNNRIQRFTSTGTFVTKWGVDGTGDGEFHHPHGLTVASNGEVIVADGGNRRIQVFSPDGTFLRKWGSFGSAADCAGGGLFWHPVGICVGPLGDVYVVDSTNHRIQRFDQQGTFLSIWGSAGSLPGQFGDFPWLLAAASDGSIYVADEGNHRIQKFVNTPVAVREHLESSSWGMLKAKHRR